MRRAAEFGVFLGLAAGVHLAVAAIGPQTTGAQSAGQQGDATVSLQAPSSEISEMVDRWDAPPDVTDQAPAVAMSRPELEPPGPTPAPPAVLEAAPVPAPRGKGLRLPQRDRVPDRTDSAPALAPEPAPDLTWMSDIRPQARPAELPRKPAAKPSPQAKKKKSAPVSPPSAAQQATGAGGGTNAGAAQDRDAATLSAGQRQSLFAQWGAQVRRRIERGKRYPSSARGASGTVQVSLTVGRDGSLRGVSVVGSSGHPALDDAALGAVRAARGFPQAPRELTDPTYTFTLAMQFSS